MHPLLARLLDHDTTLWPEGNVASNRLGWVGIAEQMRDQVTAITQWAEMVRQKHVVLIGMGGSSLGPEVLRAAKQSDRLTVIDTTDPQTVSEVPTDDTFFIVASKSGGTLEVRALLAHFWNAVPDPKRWAAITDPDTELATLAKEREFSKVFINPPTIGGRFSVLSYFGLVPAALLGYDLDKLCAAATEVDLEEAVELGLQMAEEAKAGRNKVTLLVPAGKYANLGLWLEQLIAESTGKHGLGCVPVPTTEPESGTDRFTVRINPASPEALGGEFYRWEVATAIAGHALGIDPFDEPNVTESKTNTKNVLDTLPLPEVPTDLPAGTIAWLKEVVKPGDYVTIGAYLPYGYDFELDQLRRRLRDALGGIAVTAGFGPRFLHSTGQLHKGGANNVVALQLIPTKATAELEVPGAPYDFATLIAAQAIGDYQSLQAHGRRVRRVACTSPNEIA